MKRKYQHVFLLDALVLVSSLILVFLLYLAQGSHIPSDIILSSRATTWVSN